MIEMPSPTPPTPAKPTQIELLTGHATHVAYRRKLAGRNNLLVKRLSKSEKQEGAQKLGILKNGVMVFDTEDDTAYLMDYCIHHVRTDGCNAVERELIARSNAPESDEFTCLRALQHTVYSIFIVEAVEPGLGVHVRDLRSQEVLFVMDLGFGSSAVPGIVIATRIISVAGINMTGGAAIPLGGIPRFHLAEFLKKQATVRSGKLSRSIWVLLPGTSILPN